MLYEVFDNAYVNVIDVPHCPAVARMMSSGHQRFPSTLVILKRLTLRAVLS
jgi:hypothetical protein